MNIYVAIPANSNKQWEADYATFASFWWASTLQPGETHSRAGNDNGDFVFYPPPTRTAASLSVESHSSPTMTLVLFILTVRFNGRSLPLVG